MASSRQAFFCVLLLVLTIATSSSDLDWASTSRRLGDDFEVEYGGIPRRSLDTSTGYISYDALQADSVPCTQRGASYYTSNCQPGAPANPYSRGCQTAAGCRG